MNFLVELKTAIIYEKECVIIIDKSIISDLYKFAKHLSAKFKFEIYDFSENLFILKNDYKFIVCSCVCQNNQMTFAISFIPIYNDDVSTDDYTSENDCKTDNEF